MINLTEFDFRLKVFHKHFLDFHISIYNTATAYLKKGFKKQSTEEDKQDFKTEQKNILQKLKNAFELLKLENTNPKI